jgi:hypothetical protein
MPDGSDVEAERNRLPIAMACTDVMTRTVQVPAPVFAAVHAVCEDRILVERDDRGRQHGLALPRGAGDPQPR